MKIFRKNLKDGACEQIFAVDEKLVKDSVKPERKGKKRRRLAFKVMFVTSIVSIMISVTYSWFSTSDTAIADGVTIDVADRVLIDIENFDTYGQLEALTGDGTYFFKPKTIESTVINSGSDYSVSVYDKAGDEYDKLLDVSSSKLDPTKVNGVRIMDFTLSKSGEAEEIFLLHGTEVKAYKAPDNVDPEGGEPEEIYPDAPDYLAGALRVAILKLNNVTQKYELQLIWLPDVTSTVNGTDEIENSFSYLSGEDGSDEKNVSFGELTSGEKTVDGVRYVWGDITSDSSISLGQLSGKTRFRIVVWLDGNDRETNADLIGQKFEAIFKIAPKG